MGTRDIFIHIDYMNSSDEAVTPRKEAMQKMVDAFAAEGIAVHFDAGDLYHPAAGSSPADFDLDGISHRVPFANGVGIGYEAGKANVYDYELSYMDLAKRQVFHYMLFGYTQRADGTPGSSGIAEIGGNDSIITLGAAGLNSSTTGGLNYLVNLQAATMMHEFGHNLGLMHGGDENHNYKPNYVSTMNYLYQLSGLPTIGNNEDDRYRRERYFRQGDTTLAYAIDLVNGPYDVGFLMDYSDGSSNSINEGAIDETAGLGRAGTSGVDYNMDGDSLDASLNMDLNYDAFPAVLTDYDDWAHLLRELSLGRYYREITGHGFGAGNDSGSRGG